MNIIHICLAGPVTDGWSYQDNLLSKYHAVLGHNVYLITSQYVWNEKGKLYKGESGDYINDDGVHFYRIPIKNNADFSSKFKRYVGLLCLLEKTNPDVLFVHGCQFRDIDVIVKFCKKNPDVKVFVDNHADFSNSATSWISKNILHKIVWKHYAQKIDPYVKKWYGVMPARVDFLKNVYGLDEDRIRLLVMGADNEKVNNALTSGASEKIRSMYNIGNDDFLIITGGKIDAAKYQTVLLMEAVNRLHNSRVKLLVFGSVSPGLTEKVNSNCSEFVKYIGWIKSDESYDYFSAADLVVFPGRHSVFWEQVAGLGIPMICKFWDGTTHIDVGGNVRFLYNDSADEIYSVIKELTENSEEYEKMKSVAVEKGRDSFLYDSIARRSLEG